MTYRSGFPPSRSQRGYSSGFEPCPGLNCKVAMAFLWEDTRLSAPPQPPFPSEPEEVWTGTVRALHSALQVRPSVWICHPIVYELCDVQQGSFGGNPPPLNPPELPVRSREGCDSALFCRPLRLPCTQLHFLVCINLPLLGDSSKSPFEVVGFVPQTQHVNEICQPKISVPALA